MSADPDERFNETCPPACRSCDGSGIIWTPDADGESAYEVACPDPVHNDSDPVTGQARKHFAESCPDHRPVLDLAVGWYCPACGAEAPPDEAAPGPHRPKEG